jgi:elongation factor P
VISTGDLRKGVVVEMDGTTFQIIDWEHIKVGRGSAQVRLKLRDVRGGHTLERTFQAGTKFKRIRIDRYSMQYLYSDGDMRYFMNTETYEQIPISNELVGEAAQFLSESAETDILFIGDEPIAVELPASVVLRVIKSEPGVRGDTTSGATKPATLETGLVVTVPLFINENDLIKIDTRNGAYLERVSSDV